MRWSHAQMRYREIFQSLKELLLPEIESSGGFIIEINQGDTFYVVYKDSRTGSANYFASIQVRTSGVYFQLHTFNKLSSTEMHRGVPVGYFEEDTSSLLFKLQPSVARHETALRDLIKKAIRKTHDTIKSDAR